MPHTITCRLGSLGSVLVPLCVAQPPARAMPEVQPLRHLRGKQPQGINALRQMLHRRRVQSWTLVIRVHPLRQKLGPGSAKKTSLRKWAWPREPVGLAPPIPHAMQSWGMRQSRLLFTALSGDMESSPALVNIACVGDGGGGCTTSMQRDVFFADPGVGSDERKQHKVDVGLRTYTKRRCSHTAPRDCLVTV